MVIFIAQIHHCVCEVTEMLRYWKNYHGEYFSVFVGLFLPIQRSRVIMKILNLHLIWKRVNENHCLQFSYFGLGNINCNHVFKYMYMWCSKMISFGYTCVIVHDPSEVSTNGTIGCISVIMMLMTENQTAILESIPACALGQHLP